MKTILKSFFTTLSVLLLVLAASIIGYAQTDSTSLNIKLPSQLDFSTPQNMYMTLMAVISAIVTIITGYVTIHFKFLQSIDKKVWRVIIVALPIIGVILKFGFNADVSALIWTSLTGILGGTFAYDNLLKPSGLKSTEKTEV